MRSPNFTSLRMIVFADHLRDRGSMLHFSDFDSIIVVEAALIRV